MGKHTRVNFGNKAKSNGVLDCTTQNIAGQVTSLGVVKLIALTIIRDSSMHPSLTGAWVGLYVTRHHHAAADLYDPVTVAPPGDTPVHFCTGQDSSPSQ